MTGSPRSLEADASALIDVLDAARRLREAPPGETLAAAASRGWFRPGEEEELLQWSARHLSLREILEETIQTARARAAGARGDAPEDLLRAFLLGYTAACGLVALDRFLLEGLATSAVVQRKLNEGSIAHRIPRKAGYTRIVEDFTAPDRALRMQSAMRRADTLRPDLDALGDEEPWNGLLRRLAELELHLDPSRRSYLRRVGAFLRHSLRRRGASARQKLVFGVLEPAGRTVSELRDPTWVRRLGPEIRDRLAGELRPGDVLVTRRERAFTNLFLPGFWPHAALYVGSEEDREALGIRVDEERARRWTGPCRTLEALKDGVRFRPLEETLDVDAVAVIRPDLPPAAIREGIERAAAHEGKGYNFDFDFFRSDRLVCTEVVYRAYDGLGDLELPLVERSGRPTLSAEDLLRLALDGRGFAPVAVFGAPELPDEAVTDERVGPLLAASLDR